MWKIIILFSLFAKAQSAPSGCIEMCNSLNSQSYSKLSCCGMPMVSSSNDDKNWTDHKDFQTVDGALVHTKDGRYVHGNTHGSFNEMSYYKEFGSGSNQNLGGNFGFNHNPRNNYGLSEKLEDLGTSHSSFEAMFQSKFGGLIQNFHDSFNHLQELKKKGQLETQECVYPCIPVDEQIVQLQQQLTSQEQTIQRLREDLWRKTQSQKTVVEPVEEATIAQQPIQSTHYPGQIVKEVNRHESHHSETITTHPHVTTKISYQPVKYVSAAHEAGSTKHNYYEGSTNREESSQHRERYGTGSSTNHEESSPYRQGYGSGSSTNHEESSQYRKSYRSEDSSNREESSQYRQGYRSGGSKTHEESSQYRQGYGSEVQSQQNSNYRPQAYSSQTDAPQIQIDLVPKNSGYESQGYGSQSQQNPGYASQSYGSQSHYSSQTTYSHPSSAYGSQSSGLQAEGSQTYGVRDCGPRGCSPQGGVTVSHGSISHSSMSRRYGSRFGSSDGSLTHEATKMGPVPDCDDESHSHYSSQYRRHKRHTYRHHHPKEDVTQQLSDFQQVQQPSQDYFQQSSQQVEDFGEPAKIQKVSQQEIEALGQEIEDIRHGKLQMQNIDQNNQDFTQQTQDLSQVTQNQQIGKNHYKPARNFYNFPQQTGKSELGQHQYQDHSQQSGKIELQNHHQQHPFQISSIFHQNPDFTQQSHGFSDYSQHSGKFEYGQHEQQSSQIPSSSRQNQYLYYPQNFGKLQFGQQEHPSQEQSLSQQTQDFTQQQNHGFKIYPQNSENMIFSQQHQQNPSQIQSFSHQTQDFSQQENSRFDQHSGKLEFGQHQQNPSQIESLFRQTQGFSTDSKDQKLEKEHVVEKFKKPTEVEDLNQQSQAVNDFSQHPKGFEQQTVGSLKLDQPVRDSLNFNQFPTPVLAPVNNQSRNQEFQGLNQPFNLQNQLQKPNQPFMPAKPAPKPTSRPRNLNPTHFNVDKNNAETIFNADKGTQSPSENLRHTGRGDISAENEHSTSEMPLTPYEVSDTQEGYQQSSKEQKKDSGQNSFQVVHKQNKDFSQEVQKTFEVFPGQEQKPRESFPQEVQKPFKDFSQEVQRPHEDSFQNVQKPFDDFSQHVQKSREGFSREGQKSFEDLSQVIQKTHEDSFQNVQKRFDDFSQHVQKPREGFSQEVQKPLANFSPKIEKPHDDFSQNVQNSFHDFSQHVEKSREGFSQEVQKPFNDFSQEIQKPPEDISQSVQKPFDDFSRHIEKPHEGYSQLVFSQEIQKPNKNFSQSIEKHQVYSFQEHQKPLEVSSQGIHRSREDFFQQVQKSHEGFSPQIQKPHEDFSQNIEKHQFNSPFHVQKYREGYSQEVQRPFKDFSQEIQKPHDDFSQNTEKHRADFSQQVHKIREDYSKDVEKHFNDFSQETQKPREDFSQVVQKHQPDFSQEIQKPHYVVSQQIQKSRELFFQQDQKPHEGFTLPTPKFFDIYSQGAEKPFENFSQKAQKSQEDFSHSSDLNRKEDITLLPQKPTSITNFHQIQEKLTDHTSSDMSQRQEASLGYQWHRSHNPGDLTSENFKPEISPDKIQQARQTEEIQPSHIQQREQVEGRQEKEFIQFDQQSIRKEGTTGTLEFGQNSDSHVRSERSTEMSLQPRILEAYGGRGPYDPMHSEDIFSNAKQNPSATLPPFVEGDPWDIYEKPTTPRMVYDDRVIPLDSTWVFPEEFSAYPVTEAPKPGFWTNVGRRFSSAVDKAKDKARDIFG